MVVLIFMKYDEKIFFSPFDNVAFSAECSILTAKCA